MPRFKRFSFVFFSIENDALLNLTELLRGRCLIEETARLFAVSPITSSKHAVDLEDLEALLQISAEHWTPIDELEREEAWLDAMARKGLLLSDEDEPPLKELRDRAEILESEQWHPYAALYHFMTRAAEGNLVKELVDYASLEARSRERAQQFVATYGPPPTPFQTVAGSDRIDLPLSNKTGELYETLRLRKSTRAFDTDAKTSFEDTATLLQFVFGCHGYHDLSPDVSMIHRTSPSGGARHPIEVYLLIMRVDGLATGLYHYDMRNHALELIREYEQAQAQAIAVEVAAGQDYAGSAHMLFIMTARFYRNYWKYRRRSRTYGVVLMDAAHLSQTFYLVGTDLGLATFFSADLDAPKADAVLGLDGYEEGAIAICGCGVRPSADTPDHGLPFRPYMPRKTVI